MKKGIFLTILLSLITPLTFSGEYKIHILKDGETLSELLESHGYSPLYGEEQWVSKTLEINHLKSINAEELKKGFPVILPNRQESPISEIKKNKITHENLSKILPLRNSFFNTISRHQDVLFGIRLAQNTLDFNDTNLYQSENYKLSLKVEGKNNYQISSLIYNLYACLSSTTPGIGRFKDDSERSVSFKPTYNASSGISIRTQHLPFEFGPSFTLEEKSLIESDNNRAITRRDQLGWVGFNISKDFKRMNQLFKANIHYQRKAFQSSLTESKIFEASKLEADIGIHLTENYIVGINATSISYSAIDVKKEESLGINFSYLVK
jgi:hypothetical protein